tara:strand:+ start:6777 stop:7640 length:864 start_codon:yes stop_codon:yes gene_type:complete
MEQTNVVGEVKPEKKVAFTNRKYTNEERQKKDEEELAQLVEENKAKPEEVEVEDDKNLSAEEKTFKKRYGDLRRHLQNKEKEFGDQLAEVKKQLDEATRKEIHLPKSDEDIEKWAKEYPDVAAIVETIAIKKAKEQSDHLDARVKELAEMQTNVSREKAEAQLLTMHPDFNEIKEQDEFHTWAEEQPKWIQDALYENETDARSAARAIDLYKADMGIGTKKKNTSKDAAKTVTTRSTKGQPDTEATGMIKESDVNKMSAQEYEKNADMIMEAIRSGKFIYDLSGNAR